MAVRSWATYQGYPGTAVFLKQQDGLAPLIGSIRLEYAQVRKLEIKPHNGAPFRSQSGIVVNGPINIDTWKQVVKNPSGPGSTVTSPRENGPGNGGGFVEFGDLVLSSIDITSKGSVQLPPVRYRDVYIDTVGFSDSNPNLAAQKKHDRGKINVPLTDIAKFYPTHGIVVCRINKRLPSGNWDYRTVEKDENGEVIGPWSAEDVFRFLFTQLPGSPLIVGTEPGHLSTLQLDAPLDVKGEGDLAYSMIQDLLDRYGLSAKRQPTGTYVVSKDNSINPGPGVMAEEIGKIVEGKYQGEEEKTVSLNYWTPLVHVIGQHRVKRITVECVAVIADEAGRIWRMTDLLPTWGYSVDKARRQATLPASKAYQDVLPAPADVPIGAAGAGEETPQAAAARRASNQLHETRRSILREWAFKAYAPAHLFAPPKTLGIEDEGELGPGEMVSQDSAGRPVIVRPIADPDKEVVAFMPVKDFAVYDSELSALQRAGMKQDQKPTEGDRGSYFISPPVVRSHSFHKRNFTDMDAVTAYVNADIEQAEAVVLEKLDAIDKLKSQFEDVAARIKSLMFTAQDAFDEGLSLETYLSNRGLKKPIVLKENVSSALGIYSGKPEINADSDVEKAKDVEAPDYTDQVTSLVEGVTESTVGGVAGGVSDIIGKDAEVQHLLYEEQFLPGNGDILEAETLLAAIAAKKPDLDKAKKNLTNQKTRLSAFAKAYARQGAIPAIANAPYGPAPEGSFKIMDERVGLIRFANVQGRMAAPVVLDPEQAERFGGLDDDGLVEMTYGYSTQNNSIRDLTSALISSDENGKPILVGLSRSSPIKAQPILDPDMKLYEDDYGFTMNVTDVISRAFEKAGSLLTVPRSTTGYVSVFDGFQKAVLDAGFNAIQYDWDAEQNRVAKTTIATNSPGGGGLLGGGVGPPKAPKPRIHPESRRMPDQFLD